MAVSYVEQFCKLALTETLQSTSFSTGTLVVSGGVGIARNLCVSGTIYASNGEAVLPPSLIIPSGGTYSQLISKASAADRDLQITDYWTDVTIQLTPALNSTFQTYTTISPWLGNIHLPTFGGPISDPGANQALQFNLQMPHSWHAGTDIYPHLHVITRTTNPSVDDNYGLLPTVQLRKPELCGGFLRVITSAGYINGAGQTVLGLLGGLYYSMFYCVSKNLTIIFYQTTGTFIVARGNWTTTGAHGTLVYDNLTLNVGVNTGIAGTGYVPDMSLNPYNSYLLGPYTGVSNIGAGYAYAQIAITAGPVAYQGTYNYVSENVYISSDTDMVTTGSATGTPPFYSSYYCSTTDTTIIWRQSSACYVIATGNCNTYTGSMIGAGFYPLTGNVGALNPGRANYYFPTASGTWNGVTLGAYITNNLSKWVLEYTWANIGSPPKGTPSEFGPSRMIAVSAVPSTTANEHMLITFGRVPGVGKLLSSVFAGVITCAQADHAYSYGSSVSLLSFDIHAQMSGIGYGPTQFDGS
jgi:hypothetical protein